MAIAPGSIWVDSRGTQSPEHSERGIARYVGEHTNALVDLAGDSLGAIWLDPELPIPASLKSREDSGLLRWRPARVPRTTERPGIYHVMSPFELTMDMDQVWPRVARRPETKTAVTLYDVIPLIYPERYLEPNAFTNAMYRARLGLIRRADHVFTISRRTADDAVEHLGLHDEQITVIDCGVSPRLPALVPGRREADQLLQQSEHRVRDGFLLYVGGDEPRKNLKGLIEAYGLLPERLRHLHQLVIVCSMAEARKAEMTEFARGFGIDPDDVLFTGYVPDRELVALYRCCDLFVFPSEYEGAGLPILEAMSCDAPVAASGTASIPEILGDLDATFDPANPGDIADCLRDVLDDPARREALRERSRRRAGLFTWERVARLTMEGYERALCVPPAGARRRRKRLAVITPWPPQASGIATHSQNVVRELADHVDIDLVVPDAPGIDFDRSLEPKVRLWSHVDFDWSAGVRDYDRLLYVLGNSQYHTEGVRELFRRPGAVLAHDVRFQGLYIYLNQSERDPGWLRKKAVELYGDSAPPRALNQIWDIRVFMKYGLYMSGEVQDHAEQMLVHSPFQAEKLLTERPEDGPPVGIVPLGIPDVPLHVSDWSSGPRPLVVSCGIVSLETKRMFVLLEAFATMTKEAFPDARLLVVGEVTDAARSKILGLASKLGVGGSVEVLGRTESDDYWGILRAADLAVQLRIGLNGGEPSAAVSDCIAARVPTITSDVGWLGDLPEHVVETVPEYCAPEELAEEMISIAGSEEWRAASRAAQDRYAKENSFARVAERYVTLLEL